MYETIPPFYKNLIITQLCIFTIILRYQSSTVKKPIYVTTWANPIKTGSDKNKIDTDLKKKKF